jgi:hypothetical protein
MKKLFFTLAASVLLTISSISAQTVVKIQDNLAWDHPDPTAVTFYTVAFTTSAVTNLNAVTNTVSTLVVPAPAQLTGLTNIIPSNQPLGQYNLFVKASNADYTSVWSTNLLIRLSKAPGVPNTIRIIPVP